jgi:hypothetical protein
MMLLRTVLTGSGEVGGGFGGADVADRESPVMKFTY